MAKKKRQQQKKAQQKQEGGKGSKPLPASPQAPPRVQAAPVARAPMAAPAAMAPAPVAAPATIAAKPAAVVAAPAVVRSAPPVAVPAPSPPAPPPAARELPAEAEARTHKRLPFEVNLDIVSEHNFYAGLTLNVSEGGLFVATHMQHPVGTRLEIRLVFPGDDAPTSLMTEVRWVRLLRDAGDSSPGMGLRFVDLPAGVLEKIGRFARHREPLYYEED